MLACTYILVLRWKERREGGNGGRQEESGNTDTGIQGLSPSVRMSRVQFIRKKGEMRGKLTFTFKLGTLFTYSPFSAFPLRMKISSGQRLQKL